MKPFENQEMNEYFQGLPALIQDSIIMCGLAPQNLAELQRLVEKMGQKP